jgi:hypothetical protein
VDESKSNIKGAKWNVLYLFQKRRVIIVQDNVSQNFMEKQSRIYKECECFADRETAVLAKNDFRKLTGEIVDSGERNTITKKGVGVNSQFDLKIANARQELKQIKN